MKYVEALQDVDLLKKGERGYMTDDGAAMYEAKKVVKIIAKNVKTKSLTEAINKAKEKEEITETKF